MGGRGTCLTTLGLHFSCRLVGLYAVLVAVRDVVDECAGKLFHIRHATVLLSVLAQELLVPLQQRLLAAHLQNRAQSHCRPLSTDTHCRPLPPNAAHCRPTAAPLLPTAAPLPPPAAPLPPTAPLPPPYPPTCRHCQYCVFLMVLSECPSDVFG